MRNHVETWVLRQVYVVGVAVEVVDFAVDAVVPDVVVVNVVVGVVGAGVVAVYATVDVVVVDVAVVVVNVVVGGIVGVAGYAVVGVVVDAVDAAIDVVVVARRYHRQRAVQLFLIYSRVLRLTLSLHPRLASAFARGSTPRLRQRSQVLASSVAP